MFLISSFRRVQYVVCFLLGDSPASDLYKSDAGETNNISFFFLSFFVSFLSFLPSISLSVPVHCRGNGLYRYMNYCKYLGVIFLYTVISSTMLIFLYSFSFIPQNVFWYIHLIMLRAVVFYIGGHSVYEIIHPRCLYEPTSSIVFTVFWWFFFIGKNGSYRRNKVSWITWWYV